MKKSLVKLAALSSAAFVLAGPIASVAVPVAVAQDINFEQEDKEAIINEMIAAEFGSEEAAFGAKQNASLLYGVEKAANLIVYSTEVTKEDGTNKTVWKLRRPEAPKEDELDNDDHNEDDYQDQVEKEYEKIVALQKAKEEAKKELIASGVSEDSFLLGLIDKANTVEAVESLVEEIKETRANQAAKELEEAKKAAIKELEELGIHEDSIFIKKINEAKTVEGVQNLVKEIKKARENQTEDPKPATQEIKVNIYIGDAEEPIVKYVEAKDKAAALESIKADYPGKTVTDTGFGPANELTVRVTEDSKPEEPAEPKPETPEKKGYKTKEEAEAAAKKALENDPINNAFEVSQGADGRYYYRLFVDSAVAPETPEKPEKPEKPETPEKPEETVDPLLAGYKTAEDAIKAAEALLEKMPWNNGYDIQQGADGLFYIRLTTDGTKTVNRKPVEATTEEKKEEKKEDKKEKLPETGEVSSFAIFGGAALSVLAGLGLVASKKEEN